MNSPMGTADLSLIKSDVVIYPQFLPWDTTGGVLSLATSSAFGSVRIQLTDPTTNLALQVAADFGTSLLYFFCFISVFTSWKLNSQTE